MSASSAPEEAPTTVAADDDMWVYVDGAVCRAAEARVPVLDRGFLYGDSVFEVTRTAGRRPVLWTEHMDRLQRSAALLGMTLPSPETIVAACQQVLRPLVAPEAYLRIIVTRGGGALDLDPAAADAPRLLILAKPLRLPTAQQVQDGVALWTVGQRRSGPGLLPEAKSGNYLSSVMALRAARQHGAYEAVLCDPEGYITEGATSNLFIVHRPSSAPARLSTPPLSLGLLPGITRAAVLGLARALPDVDVCEERFTPAQAAAADEVFITSSIRGVLPVTSLSGTPVGDGRPGPVTLRLRAAYEQLLDDSAHGRS